MSGSVDLQATSNPNNAKPAIRDCLSSVQTKLRKTTKERRTMNHQINNHTPRRLQTTSRHPSPGALPRKIATIAAGLLVIVALAGCASTKVSDREFLVTEKLPRPQNVWVYNFAATSAEVPAESAMVGLHGEHGKPQTAEEIAMGRQLGEEIAAQLVEEINAMGMPALLGMVGTKPQINDIVIRGYLVSIKEGSAVERVAIGFGAGSSEMSTAVEGFQMTANGLRKLGSGTVNAGGSKGPGAAVGLATFIATANPAGLIVSSGMKVYEEASGSSTIKGRAKATAKEIGEVLKKRFQQEGWIAQ
jgi:hypothetical protein